MNINIVRPLLPELADFSDELSECLTSGLVTNNSKHVRRFESELQRFYGCTITPSVYCNGELALFNLLQAWKHKLGASPHDSFEVLVPSFTFSGTINAIVASNLKPVFCDVDDTLVLDIDKAIVDYRDVRMILPVGAYGNLCDMEKLSAKARRENLVVVLDNAPAFGSKFKGRHPHEFGFSEMVSFHATKIFSSMEGGANIVNDPEIDGLVRRLRDFGQFEKTRGDVDVPGLNSKMTEVCALVGLKNLERIDQILMARSANAAQYVERFGDLQARGLLRIMRVSPCVTCPYLYFPIVLHEEATAFVEHMQERGIAVRRYYTATHTLECYRGRYREQDLTVTNSIKDNIVSLPLHTRMTSAEIDYLFASAEAYFV